MQLCLKVVLLYLRFRSQNHTYSLSIKIGRIKINLKIFESTYMNLFIMAHCCCFIFELFVLRAPVLMFICLVLNYEWIQKINIGCLGEHGKFSFSSEENFHFDKSLHADTNLGLYGHSQSD